VKAILEFNLPEDTKEHMRCVKSLDMAFVLFHLTHNFWKKYEELEGIDKVAEDFYDLLDAHGINIDELIE
jgi:hypothetical protein